MGPGALKTLYRLKALVGDPLGTERDFSSQRARLRVAALTPLAEDGQARIDADEWDPAVAAQGMGDFASFGALPGLQAASMKLFGNAPEKQGFASLIEERRGELDRMAKEKPLSYASGPAILGALPLLLGRFLPKGVK